ncbi:MAG: fused MFS/spermidine synthase [SAR202 cluster bacterium]|nr:fused MFS/spermidine synthase [SAR202 cluster bacterium]MDP6513015.1 fused MFS/spermidine synthase [SAR202 cluster bacterium]
MTGVINSLKPYLIVFTASACGLIIEIVAGRILAPSIGVSLYTWTSIIGVVLAGISLGNFTGGLIADRFPYPATLGFILLASGIASIAILPLLELTDQPFLALPILPRIVLLTTALFLLPSILLGMVTPVVIKLNLTDLTQTGNVVGRIYAVSTAGSILGTFLTGFVLIQTLGTRTVILGVSVALVVMAVAFGNLWRARWPGIAMGAMFVGVTLLAVLIGSLDSVCMRESNYFCIKVRARDVDGREVRVLYLDALLHSYSDIDDPYYLRYSYEKVFADLATYIGRTDPDMDVLFIGGGGYTMPRFLEAVYPRSNLEVVEIDPEVTEIATDYLGLSRRTRIVTYNEDARTKLQQLEVGKYEMVMGDAFNDVSVPYHLTTLEFNDQVKGLLTDDGIYAVNIVDKMYGGRFLRSFVHTMRETFDHVYVIRDDTRWTSDDRYTFVVAASDEPIAQARVEEANILEERFTVVTEFMPQSAFLEWQNFQDNALLTDDFVPVDGMLAPLYLESRAIPR